MSTYVCPRCGNEGPRLLRPNELCSNCVSKWNWSSFNTAGQQITISSEAVAKAETKPAPEPPPKTSTRVWALFAASFVASAIAIVLLVFFFMHPPQGLSGPESLNRFHTIAMSASLLGALGVVVSLTALRFTLQKKQRPQTSARVVRIISLVLTGATLLAALFCWSHTERVQVLTAAQAGDGSLLQRLQNATVVIQAHDLGTNPYQSAKRTGVVIASSGGRSFILTVAYFDAAGRLSTQISDLWVNLSDGRTVPGRIRWIASDPLNLALVEVQADAPPGQVQFHPTAEGVIPSQSVFVIPNPLQGWTLQKGTILARAGRRTNIGWNCAVKADFNLSESDVGSPMYDEYGQLLGLMTSFDPRSGDSEFIIVDSAIASRIEAARKTENVNAFKTNSPPEPQP